MNDEELKQKKERVAKQKAMTVCICKGIKLGQVLKNIQGCQTVEEVNKKAGTGQGGCHGERCGPRIKILLEKLNESSE